MGYWACAQTEPHREAAATHFLGLAGYRLAPRCRQEYAEQGDYSRSVKLNMSGASESFAA
jgi:hypothetical protein